MKMKTKIILGVAAVMAVTYGIRYTFVAATTETVTERFIRDSERVCAQNNECKYLAFGETETFENTDTWAFLKFNSSDVNRSLVKDNVCRMQVYGIRWGFMSWYRNIVKVYECKP
jgi:hypothetical protein